LFPLGKWYELKKFSGSPPRVVDPNRQEQSLIRATQLLKVLRQEALETPFKTAKFRNYEEYYANLMRREFGPGEDEEEEEEEEW
jgi:hypothetical protein